MVTIALEMMQRGRLLLAVVCPLASMVVECLFHPSCERDIKGRREEGQVLTTGEQKARSPVV